MTIALRNLNIIFALVLVLLIGKNFIRLYFERSRKFRTKLVTILIAWTFIPSILLFYVASGHIKESIQQWFSTDIKQQVDNIKSINEDLYGVLKDHIVHFSREISVMIRDQSLLNVDKEMVLHKLMETKLGEFNLAALQVFTALGEELYRGRQDSGEERLTFLLFEDEIIQNVLNSKSSIEHKPEINPQENYMYIVELIYSTGKIKQRVGVVVLYMRLPEGLNKRILETQIQVRNYQTQFLTKHQIQDTFILVFGIITLVILFSALWK